jgi:hypothetical protein
MKSEPCPECGYWWETSECGNYITGHFDRERWLTEPDCETCKKASEDRMFALGERMAKRHNELVYEAIVAATASEPCSFKGTWQDVLQQCERQFDDVKSGAVHPVHSRHTSGAAGNGPGIQAGSGND